MVAAYQRQTWHYMALSGWRCFSRPGFGTEVARKCETDRHPACWRRTFSIRMKQHFFIMYRQVRTLIWKGQKCQGGKGYKDHVTLIMLQCRQKRKAPSINCQKVWKVTLLERFESGWSLLRWNGVTEQECTSVNGLVCPQKWGPYFETCGPLVPTSKHC